MTAFAASATPAADRTLTVTATGELDMTSAPELIASCARRSTGTSRSGSIST
jgi:hypothetical protein